MTFKSQLKTIEDTLKEVEILVPLQIERVKSLQDKVLPESPSPSISKWLYPPEPPVDLLPQNPGNANQTPTYKRRFKVKMAHIGKY